MQTYTLPPQIKDRCRIVVPSGRWEEFSLNLIPLPPFSDTALKFIKAVSTEILNDRRYRIYPELMALAFWMRNSHLDKLRRRYEKDESEALKVARGMVFQLAPSNVDTIFAYGLFLSMLAGNINIVRLSEKQSEAQDVLLSLIDRIACLPEFDTLGSRFMIIRYGHDDEVTGHFSSWCDMRLIWGGDETIRRIRAIPLKPTATEIAFADKFSFCVMGARAFLELARKDNLIADFYNDAYSFGQLACSSPRVVFWVGKHDEVEHARDIFWSLLNKHVWRKSPEFSPAVAVDKLVAGYSLAAAGGAIVIAGENNLLNRIWLEKVEDIDRRLHCGGGLFYELRVDDLGDIFSQLTRKDQTVTVFGFRKERFIELIKSLHPGGIDRIVPVGQALNFAVKWDGQDLMESFFRNITISDALA